MRDNDQLFAALAKSRFRSRFELGEKELAYIRDKGMAAVESHAHDFITKRLAPAKPVNDGKQTPMKGHPVFIAQHATATCCRKCLSKWHNIKPVTELTQKQITYIVEVICKWINMKVI
jgi:hypothetical protein